MDELTDWFPADVRPVRAGWYDYRGPGWEQSRIFWTGGCFGYWIGPNFVTLCSDIGDQWRGLRKMQAGSL